MKANAKASLTTSVAWIALGAVVLCGMSGCSLRQPEPRRDVFSFAPSIPSLPAPSDGPLIAVRLIEASSRFEERGLVYRVSDMKWETDFYRILASPPSEQITSITRRWLAGAGLFRAVGIPGLAPRGSWQLQGCISELYGDFRLPERPEAVVSMRFALYPPDATAATPAVLMTSHNAREPLAGRTPKALMDAFDKAIASVLNDLVAQLRRVDWKHPPAVPAPSISFPAIPQKSEGGAGPVTEP